MLVGLLLMMHESPFPLQAMLRSESLARCCLQGEGGALALLCWVLLRS